MGLLILLKPPRPLFIARPEDKDQFHIAKLWEKQHNPFMEKGWRGLPYRPISEFYKERFGHKVMKIPVSVVDDCPNRRGLKGMQTCVFCDVWGSAANAESFQMDLKAQIEKYHAHIAHKYKAENFLIYFQAYTNSFAKLELLRTNFLTAGAYPFVRGFVVGTRPDCLSKALLQLWNEVAQARFLSVELGVQSFFNDQLEFMKRGHTREQSLRAIDLISSASKVDLGIHLMFGQPNETDEQIVETARICNDLPIANVKLHNLHVLKNTELEKIYARGEFVPIEFLEYARKVQLFLEHLSPRIFIHRLAAYASRWDELVAPAWTADKMRTHQGLIDFLRSQKSFQGRRYQPQNQDESLATEVLALRAQPLPGFDL